jgi:glycosyltransferase involved in cell wall biosynthesis
MSGQPIVIDGLAFGVLPEAAAALCERHPLVAMVHHPLALETGLTAAEAAALRESERAALSAVRRVVATSAETARILAADYGVPADRIVVAPPGSERRAPSQGSGDGTVRLLSVGAIVPRKGFDLLVAALAGLAGLPWHLAIVGDGSRDPAAAARLAAAIERHGLKARIELCGVLSDAQLAARYRQADVFVLASRFEGYGMAFAEAIAHGLPVIGTTAGAIPDTVPAQAGVLVAPDDVAALEHALRRLVERKDERAKLAAGARSAAERLPTWPASARLFAGALEALA